jgi:DNA-binding transcriptional regulator YdaS (Cro superfamily)
MAGWTAEGGVLETETREELDTTELCYTQNAGQTDRHKDRVPHYQARMR